MTARKYRVLESEAAILKAIVGRRIVGARIEEFEDDAGRECASLECVYLDSGATIGLSTKELDGDYGIEVTRYPRRSSAKAKGGAQ